MKAGKVETVPAAEVFWCVVDAPGVKAGVVPPGVRALVEDELPVEMSAVWAVGYPIDGGKLAVCAARRERVAGMGSEVREAIPAEAPEFVGAPGRAFNFLVGEFEPRTARRERAWRHAAAAACVGVASVLVAVGLHRRADAWRVEARNAREVSRAVLGELATSASWGKDELALELMQRRQAGGGEAALPGDAGEALAAVIGRWPSGVTAKPQSITATGHSLSLSVIVPGSAQAFLSAWKLPDEWRMDEPGLAAVDATTRVNLELHRVEAGR